MRRLGLVLLIVLVLPVAAAQTTTQARPSLTLEPAFREAAPETYFNATATLANPTSAPVTWILGVSSPSGVKVSYERRDITVAPGTSEHVNATVFTGPANNMTHVVKFMALETNESARAAQRTTRLQLDAQMEIRVGAPRQAQDAVAGAVELRVEPLPIALPRGGRAEARLIVTNHGPAIDAPALEFKPAAGVDIRALDVPPRIPANARIEIVLRIEHLGAQAVGSVLDGGVGLRPHGPQGFKIEIVRPAPVPNGDPALAKPVPDPRPNAPAASADVAPPVEAGPQTDAAAAPAPETPAVEGRIVVAAALASAGAGWTALWLSRHKWLPLLAALYTRLRPSRMLDHPLRKRIVELVKETPGITFSELARRLDIAPGQLTHHARMLEKTGIVFSSPDGQTRRFFHVGHGRLEAVPPLAERAIVALRRRPMRASELAKELGVSRQSVHYHVKLLVAEGKLVAVREGGEVLLSVPHASAAA